MYVEHTYRIHFVFQLSHASQKNTVKKNQIENKIQQKNSHL